MPLLHQSVCSFKADGLLKFVQNVSMFQSKEQPQVNKKRFVFEQYRQTSQRMMNVRKK